MAQRRIVNLSPARTLELTRLTSLQSWTEWTGYIVLTKPNRKELLDLQMKNQWRIVKSNGVMVVADKKACRDEFKFFRGGACCLSISSGWYMCLLIFFSEEEMLKIVFRILSKHLNGNKDLNFIFVLVSGLPKFAWIFKHI